MFYTLGEIKMKVSKLYQLIAVASLSLLINGCVDKPSKIDEAINGAGVNGSTTGQPVDESSINGQFSDFKPQTVYFGYDDYTLSSSSQAKLSDIANYLASNSASRIEIQGHCDERGTDDYNLALGLRRADSVYNYLTGLQVDGNRIVTRSFGEEKPAMDGHSETVWSKNRRAQFIILAN